MKSVDKVEFEEEAEQDTIALQMHLESLISIVLHIEDKTVFDGYDAMNEALNGLLKQEKG